jgi:hypothetical protein
MNKIYISLLLLLALSFQTAIAQQKKPKPKPVVKVLQTPAVVFGNSNVMYANVDNPITVNVEGVPFGDIQVTCADINLSVSNIGDNKYLVRPFQAGKYTLQISSVMDFRSTNYEVNVIDPPAPTPVLMLNNIGLRKGGEIMVSIFKSASVMLAQVENFDFESKYVITSFTLTRIPKKGDPVSVENQGPTFGPAVVAEIQKCKAGDFYIFSNIKAKASGAADPKPLANTIAYFVKEPVKP